MDKCVQFSIENVKNKEKNGKNRVVGTASGEGHELV